MRIVVAILTVLLGPCGVYAQSPVVQCAEVRNLGIYELEIEKEINDKNLAEGSWNVVTNIRNIRTTATVPAQLCTSFGFEYVILGAPRGAEVSLRMVTRFPNQGLYNPDTRLTTYGHETLVKRTIGKPHFRSYTIEKRWEAVLGVWTFELWYRGKKLLEQRFTLVEANPSDPPTIACVGSPIGSADTIGYSFAQADQIQRGLYPNSLPRFIARASP